MNPFQPYVTAGAAVAVIAVVSVVAYYWLLYVLGIKK